MAERIRKRDQRATQVPTRPNHSCPTVRFSSPSPRSAATVPAGTTAAADAGTGCARGTARDATSMCAAEGSLASKRATRSSNWTSRARSSVESRSGGGSGGMCARRRGKRRAHIVAGVAPPGYATLILPVAKGPERRRQVPATR